MTAGPDYETVASNASSVLEFIVEHAEKRGDATAALAKRDGKYQPTTWGELWERSRAVARGLIAQGLEPGDRVNIVAHTSLEWVIADLGVLAAAGVTVPIYPSNLPTECQYVSDHSDAKIVFCQDAEQVAKFVEQRAELPKVVRVVQMEGEAPADDDWIISFGDLLASGGEDDTEVDARVASLKPESILTIIYTSGTTGVPKGVVLTHANFIYECDAITSADVVRADDVQLLFLPLAHVFAKLLEATWFATGHVMAFAESMNTIKPNLAEVRPTMMCGVPRVYEKFYAAVVEQGTSAEGLKRTLFEHALALSQKHGELEEKGRGLGLIEDVYFRFLKKTVFAKVREGVQAILGGRMRLMISGGGPLSKKIGWFFRDAEIMILEGYGMTESSAATVVNRPWANFIGTVGTAVDGTEVKIAKDGEILLKGPGVMREYWKNPEATQEILVHGWLHTGDIGEIDPRTGALRITDRKKDLIVTAGGKNVAPQKIENLLKTHELISQAVVHGDRRKFLSALITLDESAVGERAKALGVGGDYAELTRHERIRAEVRALVEASNRELASYETIKKFEVLEADFSVETGELTPKLSVKRKVVDRKYGYLFDAFYEEKF
jgi:long-chain acyl-CoA synthetase